MRRHARQSYTGPIQVTWKDSRGQLKSIRTKCLDLSAEGARLETDLPIPSRTSVTLHSPTYGSLGTASVRHCVRHVLKYHLGVEFTSSLALAGQGRKRFLDDIQARSQETP